MLVKMNSANIGGDLAPTTLWTHDITTPGETFGSGEADLSDDINNYDYIGIKYAFDSSHYTDSDPECIGTVLMTVTDFKKSIDSASSNKIQASISGGASNNYSRIVYYVNDTTAYFGSCKVITTGSNDNTRCVPMKIIGYNIIRGGHGRKIAEGTFIPPSSSGYISITCVDTITGEIFEPKKLMVVNQASKGLVNYFDIDLSPDKTQVGYCSPNSNYSLITMGYGTGHGNELAAITSTGFDFNYTTSGYTPLRYIAIG